MARLTGSISSHFAIPATTTDLRAAESVGAISSSFEPCCLGSGVGGNAAPFARVFCSTRRHRSRIRCLRSPASSTGLFDWPDQPAPAWELGLWTAGDPAIGPVAYWGVDDIDAELIRLESIGAVRRGEIADVGQQIRMVDLTGPTGEIFGLIETPHFVAAAPPATYAGPGR